MLFIIIHQTYELWFKQILHEVTALVRHMERGDLLHAMRLMNRVGEIFRVLIQQVDVLETMTPVEFNRFRSHLNPASGFQSVQFRELEILMGAEVKDYEKFAKLEPEWLSRLRELTTTTSLRRAFLLLLRRHANAEGDSHDEIISAILRAYEEPQLAPIQGVCEHLIQLDEQISLWRFRHVQMVERMIGMKPGTGGSLGVAYLQSTVRKRFFAELWEARTRMGEGAGAQSYGARPTLSPEQPAQL